MSVYSVNVYPNSTTIRKGNWYYGAYAVVNASSNCCSDVTWYSNNTSVATVNASSGYIYAKSEGTARIYAKSTFDGSKKDYITVTVTSGTICVESVCLNRNYLALEKGENGYLNATVCPSNATNKSISWSSSNTAVATVSGGTIRAVGVGSATITARAQDGSGEYDTCYVSVTGDILVTSVSVSPSSKTLNIGDSVYLYETVCPANATNKCVKWSSSNTSVVTVNSNSGLAYAKKAGTAYIYATATDGSGCSDYCRITVNGKVYVSDITLSRSTITLYKGNTYDLNAEVCPANANNRSVRWHSYNSSVADINTYSGLVTAKSAGVTKVYAIAQDGSGVQDCCTVTVKQIPTCPEEDKGSTQVPESTFQDPVDVYTGAHLIKYSVMTLFGGQTIKLTAQYDSTKLLSGVLGKGWYHNYEKHLEIADCEAYVYSGPSSYSRYTSNDDCTVYTCTAANKNGYILTVDNCAEYPYAIDCNSERTEYYNSDGKLAKIVDHQGFETAITYAVSLITITDMVSGKKMYLEKDSSGKVVRVYDDADRQVTFTYTDGLITTICDMNGNNLHFTYNADGQVLTGTDSNGVCYFTNTYDDCGRVATQKDAVAGSLTSTFTYNDDGTRITTDRNGNTSTRKFDANGLLLSHTDENGNTKTYAYDNRYNVIKEIDANGKSIVKEYNSFNKPVSIIDSNGNKTVITYDSKGNIVKISHSKISGTSVEEFFVYNSRNQLTQYTDLRGTVTVYSYDSSAMPLTKKIGNRTAIQYSYQKGLLKSQTDAMGYTTQYRHNAVGQVISKTDASGNVTSYEYDVCGNLLKTTDAEGKTVENAYDGNHQKTSVKDANGNITAYAYNGNMKNCLITLPDGKTISYEFDGEDRPIKVTDQANDVTTTQYDKAGRVTSKHFADGGAVMYEYDKVDNIVKEINQSGAVTLKTYDANGNVISQKDNAGNIVRYDYDAMNRVIRAVNSASGATTYEYSKAGDLLSETDALGNKKTYTYDAFGNKLTATDAKGNVTSYTFDANDNLLTVKDALNNVTTYTYNSLNQLVSVKDAKNNTVTYGYDSIGRRTSVTDAKNNVFTTTYDGNGNVLKTIDAKGNTISETVYNSLNKPASVTDAMGKTTTYTYTALGKVESVVDSLNNRREFTYDSMGRNTVVREALNNTSTAEYDKLGNVTRLVGPLGGTTNYSYDEMGRLISETTPSGGTITYGYNALNVKEQLSNARGQVRKFFYDAMGRIIGFVGAEDSVSYTYDDNGNVLTVSDKNGVIKREYDALNRIAKLTDTFGKSIQYTYDAVGNLASIIYPDNTAVNYSYDANNNLVSVTDWANRVTTYTYDVNNMPVGVTKPDGSVTTTVYDNAGRIVSTVEKTPYNVVITGFEYTYDNLSRIIEEKHLADNTRICYTYDSLSRVTKRMVYNECNEIVSEESFSYDVAGNIIDAPNSCFDYDTNNRLIVFNGNTVYYDMDGNMLSNGYINCEFDSGNRLISAGGHTYTYNAEDVRIRNLCSDADTTYTYNTNCRLSQLLIKTTNGITTKYVYGLGLIGEEKEGYFKTYHFDYRGSTVAMTDINGNITDTFKYDTYGKMTEHIGNSFVIFGYNGRDGVVTDRNGLLYMRARYYSPDMHRFINADIISGEISNAITLNRYAYANGNPVSNTDPFGLSVENRGSVDFDSLYEILKKIKSQKDSKIATNMLANTLDQLMSFKNIFKISNGMSFSFPIGVNAKGSFSVEASSGKGNAEISAVVSEQIDILGSISFDMSNGSISVGDDGIKIEYSADIDKYSTVAAYISGVPGVSLSVGYTITTSDNFDNSVSTSVEMTHWKNINNQNKAPATVPVPVPETEKEESRDWSWLEKVGEVAVATGLSVVTVLAIAETIATFGAGVWNDVPSAAATIAAWARVFGFAT